MTLLPTTAGAVRTEMQTHLSRRTILLWLCAGGFAAAALPGAGHAQGATRTVDMRLKNGRVVAPKGAVRVTLNDVVELRWSSDKGIRLHLHGYDIELDVRPGETASMRIVARVAGRFPITSHGQGAGGHGHDVLTYLEVYPR